MKKVTIKDIAQKAGVANSTVTNALNPNSKKISEEKRAEILQIVDELNYIPNKIAQNLSTKSSRRIGFFLRASDAFTRGIIDQKLIYYMNKFAHDEKVELITIITAYDQEKSFNEISQQIITYNLSHVIIQGLDNNLDILSKIVQLETPKILIELPVTNQTTTFISTDNYKAQYDLTTKVFSKHQIKKPLYITGTISAYVTSERIVGFKEACQKHNIIPIIIEGHFEKDKVEPIVEAIDFSHYDYVACSSDLIAAVVAKKCNYDNLNDIIISGFDGDDILSFFPHKTYTIDQNIEQLCYSIIEMVQNDKLTTKLLDYKIIDFN